jgi:hypothetical protein
MNPWTAIEKSITARLNLAGHVMSAFREEKGRTYKEAICDRCGFSCQITWIGGNRFLCRAGGRVLNRRDLIDRCDP